jgi:hypothetical protein
MLGQWPVGGVPDFCAGAGVVDLVGVELVVAADAPAMPTAAPPAASAPATIAALSIFELCIGSSLRWGVCRAAAQQYARPS